MMVITSILVLWMINFIPPNCRIPVYDQAASNLVSGSTLEAMVQQLMDMGGGNWDKDTVQRALRAAYNNPERAVDYLYSVCTCFSFLVDVVEKLVD